MSTLRHFIALSAVEEVWPGHSPLADGVSVLINHWLPCALQKAVPISVCTRSIYPADHRRLFSLDCKIPFPSIVPSGINIPTLYSATTVVYLSLKSHTQL